MTKGAGGRTRWGGLWGLERAPPPLVSPQTSTSARCTSGKGVPGSAPTPASTSPAPTAAPAPAGMSSWATARAVKVRRGLGTRGFTTFSQLAQLLFLLFPLFFFFFPPCLQAFLRAKISVGLHREVVPTLGAEGRKMMEVQALANPCDALGLHLAEKEHGSPTATMELSPVNGASLRRNTNSIKKQEFRQRGVSSEASSFS